ncbi:MAG: hypothetical protein CME70_20310 [Halobacteriovorax sp.]|nr:hypothetical protein [Halobacteriovorax sp.]|tara:strand:+ start:67061 stop:67672 length:612 start_codon:yes stop_codon:yes gene_type:complete
MDNSETEIEIENTLILVKHALPELNEEVAPKEWQLGEKGLKQAKKFAGFVQDNLDVDPIIYSSEESKAIDTAKVLAETLGLNHKTNPDLGEIDRAPSKILDEEGHISRNEAIFKKPAEAVLGSESANDALKRFESGIKEIIKDPQEDERLIVTHGTVISLFLAKHNKEIDAFDVWQKLSCPSYVVVSLPEFKVLELNGQPLNN